MAIYGYARVSTIGQTLAAQEAALYEAGAAKVSKRRLAARQTIALNSTGSENRRRGRPCDPHKA